MTKLVPEKKSGQSRFDCIAYYRVSCYIFLRSAGLVLCGSRKYPYPTTDRISLRTPPPPWIFHINFVRNCSPPPPPFPPEFPQRKTKTPSPSGKVYFTEKDYQSKEWCPLWLGDGIHWILLCGLELEHSKLHTKQPKLQNIAYPFKRKNIHRDSVPTNQSNQSKSLWLIIDENLSWKVHSHEIS